MSWAAPASGAFSPDTPVVVRSLAALARFRPNSCEPPAVAPPANWRATPTQCVWRGRLTMRRWIADDITSISCVGAPATWWHWRRSLVSGGAALPVWNTAWRGQAIVQDEGGDDDQEKKDGGSARHIGLLMQGSDGAWIATEWRWTPPARAATRAWELRRWELLRRAVQQLNDTDTDAGSAPAALQDLWRRNLRGRPAERAGAALVWQGEHQCLRLLAADPRDDPGMPLPYAREDSRLEQRAAIQVQLARSAPDSIWPTPFYLLPQASPQQRGAAYGAVARRKQLLIGRLWLPAKNERALLRLRLESPLLAQPGSAGETRAVSVLEREMAALASLWTVDHER